MENYIPANAMMATKLNLARGGTVDDIPEKPTPPPRTKHKILKKKIKLEAREVSRKDYVNKLGALARVALKNNWKGYSKEKR